VKQRIVFRIWGRVQGVGFRWYTQRVAQEQRLAGFVVNELDGTVSGVAECDDHGLAILQAALQRGPTSSRVERLDWSALSTDESLPLPFEVRKP